METIILCIDTCGIKFSVALICNAQLIDEYTCDEIHMQCEKLIIAIETLLSNNNLHYNQINLIAVTSGPGSFNGIRIGMSAAQGISIAGIVFNHLHIVHDDDRDAAVCGSREG